MFVSGPFEIMEALEPVLTQGSAYGQFRNQSTISYFDATGEEALVEVIVSGYGSAATTLNAETVYYLSGRFICPWTLPTNRILMSSTIKSSPEHWQLQQHPHRKYFPLLFMCRSFTYMLPSLEKEQSRIDVMYIVPGNRLQQKTHGLYQLGREVHLAGYIRGFNPCVLNLSVPSGNQTSVSPTKPSRPATKRNIKIQKVGSMVATATPAPVASTSRLPPIITPSAMQSEGRPSFESPSGSNIQYPEEGEVPETASGEPETEPPFKNTYPKRRSGADMISDAYKRSKGK
ncbi:hypothetical protein PSTT_10477 [Puccinia striiformis]|uniref:Uncharacterized protein n=1 Tax=Puccinia striiformis TaxID=27350 RepID=A0A2S4V452_9BASI|nr:hypothetical protein PSTT_10477 [Puccinia striiformis]